MQAGFHAGVKHINHLKRLAMRYIPEYCATYHVDFCSNEPVVSSRLNTMMMGVTPQIEPVPPPQVKQQARVQFVGGPFTGYISS